MLCFYNSTHPKYSGNNHSRISLCVGSIEKILKAVYVSRKNEHAPYTHNLQRIAEFSGILLDSTQKKALAEITTFNLEARYPDDKRSFRKKCTKEYTKKEIEKAEGVFKWLKSMIL